MTKLQPLQTSETETEILLRPIQAYTAVLLGANVTILMLYFPVVAPFAPVVGLFVGLGSVYLFSKGF